MKTIKTLAALLAGILLIALALFHFRYENLNEPAHYKNESAVQRMDRFKKTTEVFYENKWIRMDAWKIRMDQLEKEKAAKPALKTSSLLPFGEQVNPGVQAHSGKPYGKRSPVQQAREVQKYHQDITNRNQE